MILPNSKTAWFSWLGCGCDVIINIIPSLSKGSFKLALEMGYVCACVRGCAVRWVLLFFFLGYFCKNRNPQFDECYEPGEEGERGEEMREGGLVLTTSSLLLTRPGDVGVDDAHVPGQSIVAREGLFLGAQVAAHLLLAGIVYRIFMARKVVRP